MSTASRKIAAGMGSAILIAGVAGAAVATTPNEASADAGAQQAVVASESQAGQIVTAEKVEGAFSFTQTEVSGNDWIWRNLAEGSQYLCGARAAGGAVETAAADWTLSVSGDVAHEYCAPFGEIAKADAVQAVIMGCSCLGNPADGLSAANALVTGISAAILVDMAQPAADANTVVFTSADGYEVALPLSYIKTHYCPIVFDVNGSKIAESMGGTNQLWLGSTPASYFVRDVVAISVETRGEAPVSPTSDEARATYAANLPNVGILLGGEIA